MGKMLYISERGNVLTYMHTPRRKILTVEMCSKWYSLFIIAPDDSLEEVEFPDNLSGIGESSFLDHAPNPKAVMKYCDDNEIGICDLAYDMIIGRWEQEYLNNYNY